MPFKNFGAEVLTSSDVDNYLMRQTVMTFATAAARDAALSGVLDEGMLCYLEDAPNRFTYDDGSAWQIMLSEWSTWSPSYSNLSVGNGTASAIYAYTGMKTVTAHWYLTLGSTSSVGTSPTLTLPIAPADGSDIRTLAYLIDSALIYYGSVTIVTGSTVGLLRDRHVHRLCEGGRGHRDGPVHMGDR